MVDISDGMIRRLRNLKLYKDMNDDEIRAALEAKAARDAVIPKSEKPEDKSYETKFRQKLTTLQDEFAVDMNNANDREMLVSLVRHMLQSEALNMAIRNLYEGGYVNAEDSRTLKNLTDSQSSIERTISDLQDKLGISRKMRKERQSDDIPQWINGVLDKAKTYYDRQTTSVECPKCRIILFRYWINFPNLENSIESKLTCWKCKEVVLYTK